MNRRSMMRKTAGALLVTGTVLGTGSAAAQDDEQCDDEPMTTGGQVAGACDDEKTEAPEETPKVSGGEVV